MAGHRKKNGEVNISMRTIIDDLTFIEGMSRQRKYQLRKRKQGCCTTCGTPVESKNRIRNGTVELYKPEKCGRCAERIALNKKGILQGRKERDESMDTDAEGFID